MVATLTCASLGPEGRRLGLGLQEACDEAPGIVLAELALPAHGHHAAKEVQAHDLAGWAWRPRTLGRDRQLPPHRQEPTRPALRLVHADARPLHLRTPALWLPSPARSLTSRTCTHRPGLM